MPNTDSALIFISQLTTWENLHLIVNNISSICLVIDGIAARHNSLPQRICIVWTQCRTVVLRYHMTSSLGGFSKARKELVNETQVTHVLSCAVLSWLCWYSVMFTAFGFVTRFIKPYPLPSEQQTSYLLLLCLWVILLYWVAGEKKKKEWIIPVVL